MIVAHAEFAAECFRGPLIQRRIEGGVRQPGWYDSDTVGAEAEVVGERTCHGVRCGHEGAEATYRQHVERVQSEALEERQAAPGWRRETDQRDRDAHGPDDDRPTRDRRAKLGHGSIEGCVRTEHHVNAFSPHEANQSDQGGGPARRRTVADDFAEDPSLRYASRRGPPPTATTTRCHSASGSALIVLRTTTCPPARSKSGRRCRTRVVVVSLVLMANRDVTSLRRRTPDVWTRAVGSVKLVP